MCEDLSRCSTSHIWVAKPTAMHCRSDPFGNEMVCAGSRFIGGETRGGEIVPKPRGVGVLPLVLISALRFCSITGQQHGVEERGQMHRMRVLPPSASRRSALAADEDARLTSFESGLRRRVSKHSGTRCKAQQKSRARSEPVAWLTLLSAVVCGYPCCLPHGLRLLAINGM
jgi:hypothetical protein